MSIVKCPAYGEDVERNCIFTHRIPRETCAERRKALFHRCRGCVNALEPAGKAGQRGPLLQADSAGIRRAATAIPILGALWARETNAADGSVR